MPQRKQKHQQHTSSSKDAVHLGLLNFKADGSLVTIQRCTSQGDVNASRIANVQTLRLELRTGKVCVGPAAPLPPDSPVTLGIIGLLRLERGCILALISKAKRVCGVLEGAVYKVEDTTLVAPEAINECPNDLRYASLLQEALTPKCFGGHLYFSQSANITAARQRQAVDGTTAVGGTSVRQPGLEGVEALRGQGGTGADGDGGLPSLGPWWASNGEGDSAEGCTADVSAGRAGSSGRIARAAGSGCGKSLWSRSDPRFVWNWELMRPLLEAGAESFALPLMAGYVGQATHATFTLRTRTASGNSENSSCREGTAGGEEEREKDVGKEEVRAPAELTLITRLGVDRPVAGSWRRGADPQGHTAGFAETEVVVTVWQPEQKAESAEAAAAEAAAAADVAGGGWLRRRTRVGVVSYVMTRGSAPLEWCAPPDMRLCPKPRLAGSDTHAQHQQEPQQQHTEPFNRHLEEMRKVYGSPLLLLNLIWGANRRQQLRLHDTLQKKVAALTAHHRTLNTYDSDTATLKDTSQLISTSSTTTTATAAAVAVTTDGDRGASADSPPSAASAPAPSPDTASAGTVEVVGIVLERVGQLRELAGCGAAAALMEQRVVEAARGCIRAFVCVEELEMAVQLPPTPTSTSNPSDQTPPSLARPRARTVSRRVHCRQHGVVRVSSASSASAGGCCEEVGLAQYALTLPVLAEALVAVGAMDDPADLTATHGSVVHALAYLWSHEADVMADLTHGTASAAGRYLREAAAAMEARGLVWALLRVSWDNAVAVGEAVSRYYYANFTDARRQDALDLAAGVFKMSSPPADLPRRKPPSTIALQTGILLVLAASIQVVLLAWKRLTSLSEVGTRVLAPAALGALLLLDVLRRGSSYLEYPLLPGVGNSSWRR